MPGNETPAETLDAIGLLCPEPLFQARTAIDALEPGEVLEVLADDPAAEEDLTRFAKRAGHEMVCSRGRGRLQAVPDPPRRLAARRRMTASPRGSHPRQTEERP